MGYRSEIQKGVLDALKADGGVTALVSTRVYDEPPKPPQGLTYPFIRFGDISLTANDTQCDNSMEVRIAIEAHSRPTAGRLECSNIIDAIYDALHRNEGAVTITGFRLVELRFETDTGPVRRDADGESYVGVALYAAIVEPSP